MGKIKLLDNSRIIKYNSESKILFFSVHDQVYKSKIIKIEENKIELYIFNFKKIFLVDFYKSQKFVPAKKDKKEDFVDHIKSPISGVVSKINGKENEFVKKGQTLLIIESMKMENEIKAKTDSFIKTISINVSDLVEQNQILMEFEKRGRKDGTTKIKNAKKTISNRRSIKKIKG